MSTWNTRSVARRALDIEWRWYIPSMDIMALSAKKAKVFWTGRSQAIRLPKEFRFESDTVLVHREGQAVVLEPVHDWPEGYVESFAGLSDDFSRPPQGKAEKRTPLR